MNKKIKITIVLVMVVLITAVYFLKNGVSAPSSDQNATDLTAVDGYVSADSGTASSAVINDEMIYTVADPDSIFLTGKPLFLNFSSSSCVPCQIMKPYLEEVHDELLGKMTVRYADVAADPSLAFGFPVTAVPTQYFFAADGHPYHPSEKVSDIEFVMYTNNETGKHALTGHIGALDKEMMLRIAEDIGVEI